MTDETELMQELRNACENFFDSWFGPPIGQPEHLERIEERRKKTKKEFADKLFKFVMLWMADTRHADLAPTVTDDTLSEEDLQAIVSIPMDRKYDHLNDELKHTVTDEASASENYCVSDTEKRDALEWFEDLVICSKLVSGQEPQARYIRAGILSGFYEVPSFGVNYLLNNTCSALSLFDSKDGGDNKTIESHVRARFLQLLNWVAYNYPNGIKVVK